MVKHLFKTFICYADTDAGGRVYHGNYFRIMEYAKMDLFKQINLLPSNLEKSGMLFVIAKCDIKFIQSLFLEDEITIETSVLSIEEKRIVLLQEIFRNQELTTTATFYLALLKNEKSVVIPELVKNAFENYQNGKCRY